jgi:hypothetical protein
LNRIRKAGSKGLNDGERRSSRKVSKNHVMCARCHFVGLASGIDCTWQSSAESGAARARLASRTAA